MTCPAERGGVPLLTARVPAGPAAGQGLTRQELARGKHGPTTNLGCFCSSLQLCLIIRCNQFQTLGHLLLRVVNEGV